jgi:hypothetical protein
MLGFQPSAPDSLPINNKKRANKKFLIPLFQFHLAPPLRGQPKARSFGPGFFNSFRAS